MYANLRKNTGLTLIELLIALAISGILTAGLYGTFIGQQKTYAVQEQVVDMQQNVRAGINKMIREIRMAGFGNVSAVLNLAGGVNGFTQVISTSPGNNTITNNNIITILGAFKQVSTLTADAIPVTQGQPQTITLAKEAEAKQFDTSPFISIEGTESNKVTARTGAVLTLQSPLSMTHKITDLSGNQVTIPIFNVQAIAYLCGKTNEGNPVLLRYENTYPASIPPIVPKDDPNNIILADNTENVQFEYFDSANPPNKLALPIADPSIIRMVRVTVTARTAMNDPDYKGGAGGFRERTISSSIQLRNLGLTQ